MWLETSRKTTCSERRAPQDDVSNPSILVDGQSRMREANEHFNLSVMLRAVHCQET
jgi:hypothetical protein